MKPKLKTVIVDDNPACIESLQQALSDYVDVSVDGTATNYKDAKILIYEVKPDVVFLDVEMPVMSGFDLLRDIRTVIDKPLQVVFYTAYEKYSIEAIKESAFDYLLKPVNREELYKTILRLRNRLRDGEVDAKFMMNTIPSDMLSIPTSTGIKFLRKNEVVMLKYQKSNKGDRGNWTVFLYKNETIRLKTGVSRNALLDMVGTEAFLQINPTVIVNTNYINAIEVKSKTCVLLPPFDEYHLCVSRSCMSEIRERYESI